MPETNNQMRKGLMEFIVLLAISRGPVYASDILSILKEAGLLVVEGTIYPLLSRLKDDELVAYTWQESTGGPPRKYYTLAPKGRESLKESKRMWQRLNVSIDSLLKTEL